MPTTSPGRWPALAPATLLACVLLGACDLSASPPTSPTDSATDDACTPEEVQEGGIDGRVIGPDGDPLNDILVIITAARFQGETRTGEDGVFSAPGVSGEFEISTTDIDYRPAIRQVTVPCGELLEVELVLTPVEG
ncbi:MAG: carboxypeptidase-like regulatory domain-containing protein [Chloroflexi bacterium]|nr:carboxypeptidase-like regulatory domain-containing protein [Chloroflexota bacterium]